MYASHQMKDASGEAEVALVDLIALIFGIANRDRQQRVGIQELEESRGQRVRWVVDINRSDGAMRANETKIAGWPLLCGAVQRAGERLNVGTFQTRGRWRVRRFGRVRGDAQVVVVRERKISATLWSDSGFIGCLFNARVRRRL